MCGRYTLTATDPSALRGRFGLDESVAITPRFNVAPTDPVLAVTTDRVGIPRGEMLRWGLVPGWADSPAVGAKMINARLETAAEKPAFRTAFARYRCLILADGFYEWRRAGQAASPARPGRQPFRITRDDWAPFAFAGLWSIWHGRGADSGRMLRTCTILTRPANDAIAPLHDRMPVILDPAHEQDWLDVTTPVAALPQILSGLPASRTVLREVSATVNDARHDAPDCLQAPAAAPQGSLF